MSKPTPEKSYEPRPGRIAFVCRHKDHVVAPRIFLKPGEAVPYCREHGSKMELQRNHPYQKQEIPQ